MFIADGAILRAEGQRHPELRIKREIHFLVHHAHNRAGSAIEPNGLPNNLRIGSKLAGPEAMTQNDLRILAGQILTADETAAEHGAHAQDVEEVWRYAEALEFDRFSSAGEIDVVPTVSSQRVKRMRLFFPIQKIRRRSGGPILNLAWSAVHYHHKAFDLGERNWFAQKRVGHAERGGFRTDAQAESEHRQEGNARALYKHAQSGSNVLPEGVHHDLLVTA